MSDGHLEARDSPYERPRVGDIVALKTDNKSRGRNAALALSGLIDAVFPFKYEERYKVLRVIPAGQNDPEQRLQLALYIEPTDAAHDRVPQITVSGVTYGNDKKMPTKTINDTDDVYTVTPPISLFRTVKRH